MSGNTFGKRFKVTTWGESHGKALGVVIDGCPPGIYLKEKDIQIEINRRKPAKNSRISTLRREQDQVEIMSGVFQGKTTGMPISMIVLNKDVRSQDYSKIKTLYRPGHADYTYDLKYGFRDYRGGGRSSGRETISRVMAGAIAKKILLFTHKTEIFGHTVQIGDIKAKKFVKSQIEKNEFRTADRDAVPLMNKLIEQLRFEEGDTIGAIIEIIIKNPPAGLGDPVFDKLDADLAKAVFSIGAVKGVEIGSGFRSAQLRGTQNNDEIQKKGNKVEFMSNNAGGILGGISTGQDIILRAAIKPVPSVSKELNTITRSGKNTTIKTFGRHDTCLAPRIIPVAESMAAIVLVDKFV